MGVQRRGGKTEKPFATIKINKEEVLNQNKGRPAALGAAAYAFLLVRSFAEASNQLAVPRQ